MMRGAAKTMNGKFANAISDLTYSIKIDTNNAKAYFYFGEPNQNLKRGKFRLQNKPNNLVIAWQVTADSDKNPLQTSILVTKYKDLRE